MRAKRILRFIAYIFGGIFILLLAINKFVCVTGGPDGNGQGVISFYLSEKLFVKEKKQKKSSSHYISLSYEALKRAEAIFSGTTPDKFSSEDLQNVTQTLEEALYYAKLVPDDVLDKIHPQMRMEFRQNYQTALANMLNGFKNRDQQSAIDGYKLYEKYSNWAYSHRQEINFKIE